MNSNFITKFLLLINYLIIYRIIYYTINPYDTVYR